MARRLGGNRRKSANKFEKSHRERGKISMSRLFQHFEVGDRVALVAEPAFHKGLFHSRFHGKSGHILGVQGGCYRVCVRDGGKDKTIVTPGIHLRLQNRADSDSAKHSLSVGTRTQRVRRAQKPKLSTKLN